MATDKILLTQTSQNTRIKKGGFLYEDHKKSSISHNVFILGCICTRESTCRKQSTDTGWRMPERKRHLLQLLRKRSANGSNEDQYKDTQKENDCFFQKNNGNHFFESELRMKKGWDWFFYEK